jgi:N-methylhydantoinase B
MALKERVQGVQYIDESKYRPPAYDPFRKVEFDRDDDPVWPRIDKLRGELDTLTVDVVEWGLEAAIEEAEAAVERTARSTIIREQHDYRASLNTVDCNSVTHVSWAATADPVRLVYKLEEMNDGDVFLYNDVHQSCATLGHLPDYCVVIPVFADGRIIGFAQIFGHCNDVGGRVTGSWPITSRSTFEEGMLCPPIRLYDRGTLNDEVWRIVLRNSRFPEDLRGDIDSFIGAARIIVRRTKELCERHGADVVEAAFYRIIDRCEEMVREEALPMIPNGEFVGVDFVENDGINHDKPVKIQVTVRKDPEKIIVDFEGTDPQTEGPINWPMDGRHYSKWLGGFVKAQVPGMIVNEGMTRVFRCYLPPRTVVSAREPAPTSDRMMCMLRMISAYTGAMAKAFKGQMVADMQTIQIYGIFGYDLEDKFFLYREIFGAGSGARWYADGTDTVDLVPHSKNLPAEFIEQRYPVIVERVGIYPNSGGPGQYRGGAGYLKDIRTLVDGYYLCNVERTSFAPFGVNGGMAGLPGVTLINPETSHERKIVFSQEAVPVQAGDVVRLCTPGGGGWGDPLKRDPEAVRLDCARRLVSVESAERDYGVVLDKIEDLERVYAVDLKATGALRKEKAAQRGPLKLINRGEFAEKLIEGSKIDVPDFDLTSDEAQLEG